MSDHPSLARPIADVRGHAWPAPGTHNAARLARIRMHALGRHAARLRR